MFREKGDFNRCFVVFLLLTCSSAGQDAFKRQHGLAPRFRDCSGMLSFDQEAYLNEV